MTKVSKENHEKVLSERILYLILKPHMHSKKKKKQREREKNPLIYLHCLVLPIEKAWKQYQLTSKGCLQGPDCGL